MSQTYDQPERDFHGLLILAVTLFLWLSIEGCIRDHAGFVLYSALHLKRNSLSPWTSVTLWEFWRLEIVLDSMTGVGMISWILSGLFNLDTLSELLRRYYQNLDRMGEKLCWNFKENHRVKWKKWDTAEHLKCSSIASFVLSSLEALQNNIYSCAFCKCTLSSKWKQKACVPSLWMEPRFFSCVNSQAQVLFTKNMSTMLPQVT